MKKKCIVCALMAAVVAAIVYCHCHCHCDCDCCDCDGCEE